MEGFRTVAGQHRAAPRLHAHRRELLPVRRAAVDGGHRARAVGRRGPGRDGTLEIGDLFAFVLYLTAVFAPIQQLSQVFDTYQQGKVAMDRITQLLDMPVSVAQSDHPVEAGRLQGGIRFDHVDFTYAGQPDPALTDVSLAVAPGETVAFVGQTGAGKSTLVKLAAHLYDPTDRRVLVDGEPLADLDLEAFRTQLGFVPQERSCSPAPSRTTSPTPDPTPPMPRSRPPPERSAPTTSSPGCRAATSSRWSSGDGRCRRASASSSPWPGPSSSTRRSSSSTRPPPTSTWRPRPRSCGPWPGSARADHAAHRPPPPVGRPGRPHRHARRRPGGRRRCPRRARRGGRAVRQAVVQLRRRGDRRRRRARPSRRADAGLNGGDRDAPRCAILPAGGARSGAGGDRS